MSSKPTRADAEQHVVYEIEAMCRAAVRYAQEWDERANQATPSGYRDAVFFLEASLLHARTLIMTFGFPDDGSKEVTSVLGLSAQQQFRDGLIPFGIEPGKAYGEVTELLAHIGSHRWDAPLGIHMHRPVLVATTVLHALTACGATTNGAIAAAIQAEEDRLDSYRS